MPAGEGQERERFAAAVEHGFSAVPDGDDELRRELELVALLRETGAALAPDPDASARMRAKVMAAAADIMASTPSSDQDAEDGGQDTRDTQVLPSATPELSVEDAPTLVDTPAITDKPVEAASASGSASTNTAPEAAEPAEDDTDRPASNVVSINRARGRHRFPRAMARRPDRRGQLTITAAAAVMVLAISGGGAMFSQGALPGDSLYGVKQTTESAMVGLTPGQGNKAQRQLDYAATRIDEIRKLNSAPLSPEDRGADISQALKGFNEQTAAGSRLWLSSPGSTNPAELRALANWAQTQSRELSELRSSLPANAQADADHSLRLLEDLRTRAQSLSNRQGCDKILSGESDQLGPIPAKGACHIKENTAKPPKVVTPSSPTKSNRSSSESSSEPESGSNSSGSESSSEKSKAPGLPGLGDLTERGGSDGLGPLPGREPANNGLLPKPTEQPGSNLQLPLLPILIQPMHNGLPKQSG